VTCQKFGEAIVAEALGSLGGPEAADLESHLRACADCREERGRVRSFLEGLRRTGGPAPSARFAERLRSRIAREGARPASIVSFVRLRLAESPLLRIAASLLVIQFVGLPVLATVLRLRAEQNPPPEVTIDVPPPPLPPDPVEPERTFVWPEEMKEAGGGAADLGLRDRLRPLRRARAEALVEGGQGSTILARGGAPWMADALAESLARLQTDSEAYTRAERAPLTLLALLWTEARPGRGRRAPAIRDLADRIRPAARGGDARAAFALWEGLVADAVPLPEPSRLLESLPARLRGLDAALAARMAAEALESEVLSGPFAGLPAGDGIRSEFGEGGWVLDGLLRFAREEGGEAVPGEGPPAVGLADAFAIRGFVASEGRVPAAYREALEAARRRGELEEMPPERAALLLSAFLAPRR